MEKMISKKDKTKIFDNMLHYLRVSEKCIHIIKKKLEKFSNQELQKLYQGLEQNKEKGTEVARMTNKDLKCPTLVLPSY